MPKHDSTLAECLNKNLYHFLVQSLEDSSTCGGHKIGHFISEHTFLVQISIDDDCVFAVQEEIGAI